MKSKPQNTEQREHCDSCRSETPHAVGIEIRTENEQAEHSSFSREPYRVTTCAICGEQTSIRMNDR